MGLLWCISTKQLPSQVSEFWRDIGHYYPYSLFQLTGSCSHVYNVKYYEMQEKEWQQKCTAVHRPTGDDEDYYRLIFTSLPDENNNTAADEHPGVDHFHLCLTAINQLQLVEPAYF